MPVQLRPIEVLFEGLQQKTDKRSTLPGRLERADNVEFDKTGSLNKRRGYQIVGISGLVLTSGGLAFTLTVESTLLRLATCRDELVLFGREHLYALGSRDAQLVSNGLIHRGPTMRGASRILHVYTSSLSEEVSA